MAKSDPRKAAIFLASLPRDDAFRVLAKLSHSQVTKLTREIADLESLHTDQQNAVLGQFAHALGHTVSAPAAPPFDFLENYDRAQLISVLAGEHPQTAALIISQMPKRSAIQLLAALPADHRGQVIERIAALGPIESDVVQAVVSGLRNQLAAHQAQRRVA